MVESVLVSLAPSARIIHLCHEIPPFDVASGGRILRRAAPFLPEGVVLAVVDPGVGTPRRALAARVTAPGGQQLTLVGPDNGLIWPLVEDSTQPAEVVVVDQGRWRVVRAGTTFDGRDLFAPIAARLLNGASLAEFGPRLPASSLERGPFAKDARQSVQTETAVVGTDRFGNVQLDLEPAVLVSQPPASRWSVVKDGELLTFARGPARSFEEAGADDLGIMVDSAGMVSLFVRQGSAARRFGLALGDRLEVRPASS